MNSKTNILFLGVICSEKLISEIINKKIGNPHTAAQKYNRLLMEGIVKNPDIFTLKVVSQPEYNLKQLIKSFKETQNGVNYLYLTYCKYKSIKLTINSIKLLYLVAKWKFQARKTDHYLMFDVLHLYSALMAFFYSKIMRIKKITIITDLPDYIPNTISQKSVITKLRNYLENFIIKNSDVHIALTQQTLIHINTPLKKSIIIEGLVNNSVHVPNLTNENIKNKIIHYSGGLYENYGVKALIEAFMQIPDNSIEFHLFGNGDLVDYVNACQHSDHRIKYFGYQSNQVVIEDQLNSFILVNPRFSCDDFTKYSFPSKTVEYMASGVPLLTNRLEGIPSEYFNYAFIFEEETIDGYKKTLEKIIKYPKNEMIEFGKRAQNFVLDNKNNKLQALRLHKILIN